MEYVGRLPFILALCMTIIVGFISYFGGLHNKDIFLRMSICMAVFYVVGIFVRNTIAQVMGDIEKIKQKEVEELEEKQKKEKEKGKNIDLSVSDDMNIDDSDFEPLKVSEFLKNELKT